ncbi:MAG: asparaginase [Oscillospiraceae bacterium]|nr:asparaginase [Oscillospiraceae bacterium]
MNKILMITTGGTLACTPSPEGLTPTLSGKDIIEYAADRSDIDILDFRLIDSSIMTDDDRLELAELIWRNRNSYDSFIITHGTDSMSYTAAFLDCALQNFKKTIVLTGAQLPLVADGTDAINNLNLAVRAARHGYWGVCLAIHSRLIPAHTANKFETVGFEAFEAIDHVYLETPLEVPDGEETLIRPYREVGLIYITPNLKAETILKYDDFDRMVVLVLGAGGMLKAQEAAFDVLREKGLKIYIKSQCDHGDVEALYAAHSGVRKYIPVTNASIEWVVYAAMFGVI